MAEGGIPVDSVLRQHEEFFEHTCTRCEKRERNVEASCYCRSCDKYLCTTCRDFHEDFASDHVVLDASKSDLWGVPIARKLDMDECPLHEGQHITIFCGQHESLGCTVCATSTHSTCETKMFVPDVAKDIANNQDMQYIRSNIHKLQIRLTNVRNTKEQMKVSLKDSRTNYNKTVAEFKIKVDALLCSMIEASNDNMDQLYQRRYSELEKHLDICDTLFRELADLDTELADDSIVDTKRFIMMKNGKEQILECMAVLNNLSQPMDYDINFSLDKKLLETFENTKSIGTLCSNPTPGKSTEITGVKNLEQYNVRATDDKKTCYIQGICMLADGTIIMSDYYNSNIKRLDENYVTREVCSISGHPYGVCCTGKRTVAVALGSKKKVQMVSVTDKMRLTEELVFNHNCNGIACHKDTLYITGGFIPALYEYTLVEDSGKTTCNLIRTFCDTNPRSVAVSGNGEFVYIVGINDKLTIKNRLGDVVQSTEHPDLKKYGETPCVCVDMRGNVIVSGSNVGIIPFKNSGTEQSGVLITKEVIGSAGVVFVDYIRSKLIVVQRNSFFGDSDTVNVWDIEY